MSVGGKMPPLSGNGSVIGSVGGAAVQVVVTVAATLCFLC